jgi:RND family efflux transporter MFP subunit
MPIWKQALLAAILIAGGAFAWLKLDPNAAQTLARYGLDHPVVAALASTPETAGQPQRQGGPGAEGRGGGMGGPRSVVVVPVEQETVNSRLNAIGDGQAVRSVTVRPYTSGTIARILVESGQQVAEGDVLVELDSVEQTIAVERARLSLQDAENTLQRYNTLQNSSAISNVEVTNAELAVQTARLALREAELNLERRVVRAPIEGIIGITPVNLGDYVSTDTEIASIDDRSEILVDFYVPERFAVDLEVAQPIQALAISRAGETYDGVISAIDNRVDPASRTLRVRATVENDDDALRAGMSFSVTMTFDGETYPSVNPLAIQWSNEGSFVWSVTDDRTTRVPVQIIQRNPESVLVEAELAEGDPVIIEGLTQLREGAEVAMSEQAVEQPVAENTVQPQAAPQIQ